MAKKIDKKNKLIMQCARCVGNWGCTNCYGMIFSHGRVVRPFKINGKMVNRFFCTRLCFKEFLEKYAPEKIKKKKKEDIESKT